MPTAVPIAPGLLVAMPQLADPNFSRAVVLMIEHTDEGSFGLILNQPSEITAREMLESLELRWRGPADAQVFVGGPVNRSMGWVLHEPMLGVSGESVVINVAPGMQLTASKERLRRIAVDPPERCRLLLGYAGWGPGQLAREMAEGSWICADASAALIFESPPEDLWAAALRSVGIASPEQLATGRGRN